VLCGVLQMPALINPIRVVIVDDHVLVRHGLLEILNSEDDIEVVGEAGDSAGAVTLAGEKRPDIVLLDVEIPGDEVATTVRAIRRLSPSTKLIILSMYDGPTLLQELLALGVNGYLLKSITRQDLVAAIRTAQKDNERALLSVSRASLARAHGGQGSAEVQLSQRERMILQLVASAMSNAQIANRLSLTEATVKRHLRNIFSKLNAVSRIDAVNKAIAGSLIDSAIPDDATIRGGKRHMPPGRHRAWP
jgi:DNA-binding NarL/FixJ family response regulator